MSNCDILIYQYTTQLKYLFFKRVKLDTHLTLQGGIKKIYFVNLGPYKSIMVYNCKRPYFIIENKGKIHIL